MMKARKPFIIAVILCFFASLDMQAQQTSKASDDSWVDLTENLMAAIPDFREGPNALMNGIGALGVEPQSGRLYVFVQLNGLYLSEDMGQTFKRIDEGKVLGRMLGGGNISVDPEKPGRAAFFTVDALDQNGAGAITLDGGKTLKAFKKPEIDGFHYSDNAGLTWQHLWEAEDTAPPGYRGGRESIPRQSYGWDPTHHLLYATSRNGKLMRRILPAPAE